MFCTSFLVHNILQPLVIRGISWAGLSSPNLAQPDNGLELDYMKSGLGSSLGLFHQPDVKPGWAKARPSGNLAQLEPGSNFYLFIFDLVKRSILLGISKAEIKELRQKETPVTRLATD